MRLLHAILKQSHKPICTTMVDIKTFIFLDSETTGLPHLECNKTRITELCLVAVQADHLRLGVFPRIHNKLNFCFNPGKFISSEATKLTGLSNELLEYQSYFNKDTVASITSFINHNPKPVCFVAHNGNRFDYPILQAEIDKTGLKLDQEILCIDSLVTFKGLDNRNREVEVQKTSNEVPIEFSDGFDEILCNAVTEYEKEHFHKHVAEVQKINETTPKKQIMSHKSIGSLKTKLNFGNHSYKLGDVFTRLTSKKPLADAHHAEADVNMLVLCAATLGDDFVDWANGHCKKFNEIEPMTTGKPIC